MTSKQVADDEYQQKEDETQSQPQQQTLNGQRIGMVRRKAIKKMIKNQSFGEEDILKCKNRSTTVTCTSDDGLLFVVPKIHYQIIQENRNKSCSYDQSQNQDSKGIDSNFAHNQNIKNKQFVNELGLNMSNSSYSGSQQNLILSKVSPKRQFTKLQMSQMQNNSTTISSFSKTNKQIQEIFNQKMQKISQNSNNNSLFQSNIFSANKLNEENEQSSQKQEQLVFNFLNTNSQDTLSNNNSKFISSMLSDSEVQEQNPNQTKSSQFRVRKYLSDRSIVLPKQAQNINEVEQSQNNKFPLLQEELQSKFGDIGNQQKSDRVNPQEIIFRNKSISSGNKFGLNGGYKFQLKFNGEQNNTSIQENQSNTLQQKFNLKNIKDAISTSIEILPSTSQRGFQSPMKTTFTPSANPMRRTFFQDQNSTGVFKKRGLNGLSLGSTPNNQLDINNKFGVVNKTQDEFNYPVSDIVEGDTQKNAGSNQQQTFSSAAAQHKLNSIVSFSSKSGLFDRNSQQNIQDNFASPSSKISFRKKNNTAFTGSCNDFQVLKNIDADEITKQIKANINSQIKFSTKNSSSVFISNNLDKSTLSSQQNIFSGKSTAAPLTTKVQLSTSNQSSPKKNFIVKKQKKNISSNQDSTNNISSFNNMGQSNDGQLTNKQQEQINMDSSFDESDESFMMYGDYTTQMMSSMQIGGVQSSQDTKIEIMENSVTQNHESVSSQKNEIGSNQKNVNTTSKQLKIKPSIPLLDLKSLGNENSQINNFFGSTNNNNKINENTGQMKSLSISQINFSTKQQEPANDEQSQQQKNTNKLQRQQSLNIRPSTPSVKKLDLTNLSEQIKKQTPVNQQKDVGFNELTQQRLIFPSFNTPQIQNKSNENLTTQNKVEFFSPQKKLLEDNKTADSNIFSISSQSPNQLLSFFQNNKSKQPIQNLNSLYQGLIKNQNYKKKVTQVISNKNTMSIQDQS